MSLRVTETYVQRRFHHGVIFQEQTGDHERRYQGSYTFKFILRNISIDATTVHLFQYFDFILNGIERLIMCHEPWYGGVSKLLLCDI